MQTDRAASRPVFVEDWWLDAACEGRPFFEIEVTNNGDRLGSLRYITHRNKIGGRLGLSPFWSHLGGPVLSEGLSSGIQRRVVREIAERLPRDVSFNFMCDATTPYADIVCEEFGTAGFGLHRQPTYLRFPGDPDILAGMKGRHRAQIRAAMRKIVVTDGGVDDFIGFYRANLPARSHSPLSVARTILHEGIRRRRARILFARNGRSSSPIGGVDAAIACAWDSRRYYYWLSARRRGRAGDGPEPNREATKVLILAAVEHARSLGLVFDADSPETAGGRALFDTLFGFERIEFRNILTRRTTVTALYDRLTPVIKQMVKRIYPAAPLHAPGLDRDEAAHRQVKSGETPVTD